MNDDETAMFYHTTYELIQYLYYITVSIKKNVVFNIVVW